MCCSANRPFRIELANTGSVGVMQAANAIDSSKENGKME
jgi:hypothetical protein